MDIERFWSKVDKRGPDDCWEWLAAKARGYGYFAIKRPRQARAHRVSAVLAGIIDSLEDPRLVRHTCDNPACVNPAHLLAGSHQDNVNDREKRRRRSRKVNPEMVTEIRAARARGESQQSIADRLGISQKAVFWNEHNTHKADAFNAN